ncbi:MAG TPA: Nif3-like dinuclear metal center hexameric protein [Candidatus Blautia pullicola]|uniref:GTP cyclohydrolase 1 type 2 homolog n=1 Tax=Candidatus Blautia pullicola TaxID=2838498 RepID=A0A9D2FS74_9FIRM|nr:Nif3-like dinuclear metal center hexameric protein [Candidatus Blautia pullicola]
MKGKEIIRVLEEHYPLSYAESWDNSGFLAGDPQWEVKKIFLALDVTDETIEAAAKVGADMMITHHPLIFSGMKSVRADDLTGRKIIRLIENKISSYAMHTNFDVLGMADLSGDLLGLTNRQVLEVTYQEAGRQEGIGRVGSLERPMCLKDFGAFVKERFSLPFVKLYGNPMTMLERAAICTGSGKSLLKDVLKSGAQVYVTGDMDYHNAIDAVAQGVCIVDAGHYGTEYLFMEYMEEKLKDWLPQIEVAKMEISHPCQVL